MAEFRNVQNFGREKLSRKKEANKRTMATATKNKKTKQKKTNATDAGGGPVHPSWGLELYEN